MRVFQKTNNDNQRNKEMIDKTELDYVAMGILFFALVEILSDNRSKYTPKIWSKEQNL